MISSNKSIRLSTLLVFFILLVGCATTSQYRTNYDTCTSGNPIEECAAYSIQEYHNANDPDSQYVIGFVEFDDQGQLHDRKQMNKLIEKLNGDAASRELLMVVFVHGWKHNARPGDDNITNFRKTLKKLSRMESAMSRKEARPTRQVTGVYLGWRGASLEVPLLEELTFWDRKNTAQEVGHNAVTEVLSRLEELKKVKTEISGDNNALKTRLVVVGHSFGGAVVHAALSQILTARFTETLGPPGVISDVYGFGDLVVLINPAFEAIKFATLSDMANERRTYFASQLPVLAILTSEADWVTKYAFRVGRFFSTIFEKHRTVTRVNGVSLEEQEISQASADKTAVGHFKPYQTHRLEPSASPELKAMSDVEILEGVQTGWSQDEPGKAIQFNNTLLKHLENSVARNPYLVVQVDKDLIPGHSDIYDERVTDFLRDLILLSTQE